MLKMIKYIQMNREEDFMLEPYLEYLEILDNYCQNDFQEIYICRHKEKSAFYLLNLIRNKELFYDVDFNELKECISFVEEIKEIDEAIIILTKHYSYKTILEYIKDDNMTLAKQVNSTTYLMETLLKSKNLPYSFVVSLFNHNNLAVYSNGDIKFTGLLLLTPNILNASREDTLITIANTIHKIFTGTEIIDDGLSRGIPPDIEKIINNCLNGNYFRIVDLVTAFKSSNIYKLINPEKEEIKRVVQMRKSMTRKRITYNVKTRGILVILLLIPVIVFGARFILKNKKFNNAVSFEIQGIEEQKIEGNDEIINEVIDTVEDDAYMDDFISDKEVMDKFFDENAIMSLKEKNIAIIDNSKYHRGEYSLKTFNDNNEKAAYLISYIDLEDDKFDFLKNRTVNLSLWLSSDIATDCSITLKLGSKDKILTQVTKKANLIANTWTLHNIDVNTKNGQYIKTYIDVEPNETIWIDTIDIDILK